MPAKGRRILLRARVRSCASRSGTLSDPAEARSMRYNSPMSLAD